MPISVRYNPEWSPGEASNVGMDFSSIIPPGVGIEQGTLSVFTNMTTPQDASADFLVGPVFRRGRAVYARVSGGVNGRDYQLRFTVTDTEGNVLRRTALLLCAETS